MTNSVGSMTSRRSGRRVWLRRRLIAASPLLRVPLQIGVGWATLTQHEAIALTLTGVATLLEIVQDRHTAHGLPLRRRPELPLSSGDPSPDQKLDTPATMREAKS